jgi:hypothetical protein
MLTPDPMAVSGPEAAGGDQFNLAGARGAGYSDREIADFLAPKLDFELALARAAGFSDKDIVVFLSRVPAPIVAKSADGVLHMFPAGTGASVIDSVMKRYTQDNKPAP